MTERAEKFTGIEAVLSLCLFTEATKKMSVKESVSDVIRLFNEVYHERGSAVQSLGTGLSYSFFLLVAKATHHLSKHYHKLPDKLKYSDFARRNLFLTSAEVLNRMNKWG